VVIGGVAAGPEEPTKYWLSNLPAETPLRHLVRLAKHRWIVERDYLELKQELGLGHFEGRSWRGFHHHATLCVAAYGFLVAQRSLFSPRRGQEGSRSPEWNRRRDTGRGAAQRAGRRLEAGSITSIRKNITGWLIRQLPCCRFCKARRLWPSSIRGRTDPVGPAEAALWVSAAVGAAGQAWAQDQRQAGVSAVPAGASGEAPVEAQAARARSGDTALRHKIFLQLIDSTTPHLLKSGCFVELSMGAVRNSFMQSLPLVSRQVPSSVESCGLA
jgi:hypothetical protein